MSHREEILARIRNALGTRSAETPPTGGDYKQSGSLTLEGRVELFVDRLHDYDAVVHSASVPEIAATIATALTARGKRRIVVPPGFPTEWLPDGFEFLTDDRFTYHDLDHADGVLTTCASAIALTGTIILHDGPGQGRRATSLIPDYHLCNVHTTQIVETVPEAFRSLSGGTWRSITTISGPSATSDIEMTRIRGVHGPRTLEVVLVG